MTEIDKLLNKTDISENSKTTYKYLYKRLRDILDDDIIKTTNKKIIEKIKTVDASPNSVDGLIKVAIEIKKINKKQHKQLDKFKINYKATLDNFNEKKKEELSETILKPKDLYDYLEKLRLSDKLVEYIINYLIIHFNTRNKDLDLHIVDKKKNTNDTGNFLFINKKTKKVIYFRNDYKTAKAYGKKINEIDDPVFYNIINKMRLGKLVNVAKSGFNKTIQRMTLNGMGTGMYFKIISSDDYKPKQLKLLSENRGSRPATIMENYIVD
jgi:hypothetical protein